MKRILVSAVAVSAILAAGAVQAADNHVYLTQDGGQTATITQSGDSNTVARDASPFAQTGPGANSLTIDQIGNGNDIISGSQQASSPAGMTLYQEGAGNVIGSAAQSGGSNLMSVSQVGNANGVAPLSEDYSGDLDLDGDDDVRNLGGNPDVAGSKSGAFTQSGNFNFMIISVDGDRNFADVRQSGDGNQAYQIYAAETMVGNDNVLRLSQDGVNNQILFQETAVGDNNTFKAAQLGDDNIVSFEMGAGENDNSNIFLQEGYANEATLTQFGSGNTNLVKQQDLGGTAELNTASITQNSDDNTVNVLQGYGDKNASVIVQGGGDQNHVDHVQFGDENSATATQSGNENFVVMLQNGTNYSENTVTQTGYNNGANVFQTGGDTNTHTLSQNGDENFSFSAQTGNLNASTVTQKWDNNDLDLRQTGDNNSATVQMTGGDFGDIQQNGNNNTLNIKTKFTSAGYTGNNSFGAVGGITQDGNSNGMTVDMANLYSNYNQNNSIGSALQDGDHNSFYAKASGAGVGNSLGTLEQSGDYNNAKLFWGRDGEVGEYIQRGDYNYALLNQEGKRNYIGTVLMDGDHNGFGSGGGYGQRTGIWINQVHDDNVVMQAEIHGSNNHTSGGGYGPEGISVAQDGYHNGEIASRAVSWGSNGNEIKVQQKGDRNNFDLEQGADASSTGNHIVLRQGVWGSNHNYGVTASYDNYAKVRQTDELNSATIDQNGGGQNSADIEQDLSNTLDLVQSGFQNEAFVVQGVSNVAMISQTGIGNMVNLNQAGTGNVANVSQSN